MCVCVIDVCDGTLKQYSFKRSFLSKASKKHSALSHKRLPKGK